MPRQLIRSLVFFLVIAALGAGGWWRWSTRPKPIPTYRTAEVRRTDITASISATGTIVPEDTIDVGAQVNGQIAVFGKDAEGNELDYRSPIQEGALLAKIDDALYAADVATAQAQLASAEAQVKLTQATRDQAVARLDQADRDFKRAQTLVGSEAIAQADYDAAKSMFDQARANLDVVTAQIGQAQASVAIAQASVMRAKRNLAYCTITSPVSGVIIDKRVDVGQTVVASLNAPSLFLIAKDLRKMLVLVQVNEADINSVQPGKQVTFTVDASPEDIFKGEVRKVRLNATMTQNVVTYTVEIATDNAELRLLPYLTANVRFVTKRVDDVLTVPNAALRFTPSGLGEGETAMPALGAPSGSPTAGLGKRGKGTKPTSQIWVKAADGSIKPVDVTPGLSDGTITQITPVSQELAESDQVVLSEIRASAAGPTNSPVNPFAPAGGRRR